MVFWLPLNTNQLFNNNIKRLKSGTENFLKNPKMIFRLIFFLWHVDSLKLPGLCKIGQFYESSLMDCLDCPSNVSLTTSLDGFSCSCEEHSIPTGVSRCKPCNVTEVVSADGASCVPRRCQSSAGKIVCRKCPIGYIAMTQNIDGSPMKEVQCVKCARGYKAKSNQCVRCEACTCNKNEIIVVDKCVPKKYITDRPKYTENRLHPSALLEVVKLEYLCTEYDLRACRALASVCVRNFYTTDAAGPCRLWINSKMVLFKGLPSLTLDKTHTGYNDGITIERGQDILSLVTMIHTAAGGFKVLQDSNNKPIKCLPPTKIKIGNDVSCDNVWSVTHSSSNYNDVYEIYLESKNNLQPLSLKIFKPNGYTVQKGTWSSTKLRRFFLIDKFLSITTNLTSEVYLKELLILIRIVRDTTARSSLKLHLSVEVRYETKSPLTDEVTTSVRVQHDMPRAGVLKGLEIWGGVFGASMALYGLLQWRGILRRGGPYIALLPTLASTVADGLYFATFISTLHGLAAEAGTLGLTLPLSNSEENAIKAVVFAVLSMKILKIAWVNWWQCRCDVFFIDWLHYNSTLEGAVEDLRSNWKVVMLAKEWMAMQTRRRVSPILTVPITLLLMHVLGPWLSYLPKSEGYRWAVSAVAWWSAYATLFLARLIIDRILGSPANSLPRVCTGVGLSLLVFQEEHYAHYIHGRNEDATDSKITSGALSSCRLVCCPQLRTVYKKLAAPSYGCDDNSNRILLTRFLAAFFDRALDGLSWVASERTLLERLFDVELVDREGGNTSILLYDSYVETPSCFAVTWWGEEWCLAMFDAMLFGSIYLATNESLIAGSTTLIVWQIMKHARNCLSQRNLKENIRPPFM